MLPAIAFVMLDMSVPNMRLIEDVRFAGFALATTL